jgi:hypothetical protein
MLYPSDRLTRGATVAILDSVRPFFVSTDVIALTSNLPLCLVGMLYIFTREDSNIIHAYHGSDWFDDT